MEYFDLALGYEWEYDEDFINLTERILQEAGISTFIIKSHNISEVTEQVKSKKLSFGFYLDRASDVDSDFEQLAKLLTKSKTTIFNPYDIVQHAIDKASMHLEFMSAGLNVPYSIIIAPHSEKSEIYISVNELALLGRPFIIKPCNTTGGGIGVVTGAESLKEVLNERMKNENDKYLIQQKIYPEVIDGRRAWFRCFWAFGKPIVSWWDDQSHIYNIITPEEKKALKLNRLNTVIRKIANINHLDFFSTEIVYTPEKKFIVIDYVNDQCDMRFKSAHFDGVPDDIIIQIIKNLKNMILKFKRKSTTKRIRLV